MLHARKAKVLQIITAREGGVELLVEVDEKREKAICYPDLVGDVSPGDEVLINTTAVDLNLGTGGFHFIICNLSHPEQEEVALRGRTMKLRYAPHQLSVVAAEEDDPNSRERVLAFETLGGMPVICCELHSQIAPAAAALKALTAYKTRLAYVMTDGAALPIGLSRLVAELKDKGLVDVKITCGQAFGGDFEAINTYSALIVAKQVAEADAVIVCQGPGNAGTSCKFGFSGIEQGEAINACNILGGVAIAVPRISFADFRERHRGLSHHTVTVLGEVALTPALVPLPEMSSERLAIVQKALEPVLSKGRHKLRIVNAEIGIQELKRLRIEVNTMGRSVEEDSEFFLAASAGGVVAAEVISGL
ncbi:MAG: DUF3866 family protein [Armatimonadota bacterium]|nr:DUF3866 family protein [Armatimonadota bacterium]